MPRRQLCRILFSAALLAFTWQQTLAQSPPPSGERYVEAAKRFADAVIEHGRDRYGDETTPLFVDGLHSQSLEPALWQCRGETWVLSNFASQQPLVRLLDGLTAAGQGPVYRQAAEQAAGHVLEHLVSPNGLVYWGGHMAWDLKADKAVGQYGDSHELKGHQPYYRLMHRVNPTAAQRLMETVWAAHVLDWSRLDYNRHGSLKKACRPQWEHDFDERIAVPFPASGSNLSFCNVTPPLVHAGVMLSVLDTDDDALAWTRRLALRWQECRDPATGLSGGQLSYREHDRAQDALGHVHPTINEAKVVASYHQTSRYHHLPLVQMQAAETLIAADGDRAALGRELLAWAADDLTTYWQKSYDPESGKFLALMTDGTPLQWREAKTDYYTPSSFAPKDPDSSIFWAAAMAYRMTGDEVHLQMARTLGRRLGLAALDAVEQTDATDWRLIYGLLEIHRARGDAATLKLACRVGDNLIAAQARCGLFPRRGRQYARTGDEIPLALLHLGAAVDGRRHLLPAPIFDQRFFHCEYHGRLEEHQKKRADKRTYDNNVHYGS